jgi:acylpyruvate hydrolase
MKFTTFIQSGMPRLGLVDGEYVIDMHAAQPQVPTDLRAALTAGVDLIGAGHAALAGDAKRLRLSDLTLAPLIPEPGKTICLGLNYYDHAAESGREKPDYPWFFFRGKSSLIAHEAAGLAPKVSEKFDFEGELAVIIGRAVPRHVTAQTALDYIAGYSVFNDMSVRDFQKRTPQWTIGKNFDATGAFGPVMVTADELPAGAENLRLRTRLNGEVMQDANTCDMIFNVSETLVLLSACMTLEPGDTIVMGTPAGVGQARSPQLWMKAGDVVEVEIQGIGTLRNPIVAEGA